MTTILSQITPTSFIGLPDTAEGPVGGLGGPASEKKDAPSGLYQSIFLNLLRIGLRDFLYITLLLALTIAGILAVGL